MKWCLDLCLASGRKFCKNSRKNHDSKCIALSCFETRSHPFSFSKNQHSDHSCTYECCIGWNTCMQYLYMHIKDTNFLLKTCPKKPFLRPLLETGSFLIHKSITIQELARSRPADYRDLPYSQICSIEPLAPFDLSCVLLSTKINSDYGTPFVSWMKTYMFRLAPNVEDISKHELNPRTKEPFLFFWLQV